MMNNDELLNAASLLVSVASPLGALLAFDELTLQRDVKPATWRRCAELLEAAATRARALGFPSDRCRKYTSRAADCRVSADWVERTSSPATKPVSATLQWIPVIVIGEVR
jgi:hypothetical protein